MLNIFLNNKSNSKLNKYEKLRPQSSKIFSQSKCLSLFLEFLL